MYGNVSKNVLAEIEINISRNVSQFFISTQVMTPANFASATRSARSTTTVATTTYKSATTAAEALLLTTDASFSLIGETRGPRGRL